MKLTIFGTGVMGTIFQKALIKKSIFTRSNILTVDRNQKTKHGDMYLFAVKPQDFEEAAKRLEGVKNKLVISIMAGIPITRLKKTFPGNKIIRSMPNLGAQSFKSMTVWMSNTPLNTKEKALIKKIFSAIGEELEVKNEKLIDAATAVSGSGPGYIYYFAKKMIDAAMELGFSKKEATTLVKQTFSGAIRVWEDTGLPADALENKVTSKGGTTEAGIKKFHENKLGQTIIKGIKKAHKRAKELSKL